MAEIYRRLFLASTRQFAHLLVCANIVILLHSGTLRKRE